MPTAAAVALLTGVPDVTAPGAPTVLDDITVENSTIKNTSFAGIVTKQYAGAAPGAVYPLPRCCVDARANRPGFPTRR